MKSIILHNQADELTFLVPCDNINYIVGCGTRSKVILKHETAGVYYMEVDESLEEIYAKCELSQKSSD